MRRLLTTPSRPLCSATRSSARPFEAKLHSSGGLVVHRSQDPRVVILEYEVHGRIVTTGVPYDNRFISVSRLSRRSMTSTPLA